MISDESVKVEGEGVPIKWHRDASMESVNTIPAIDIGYYLDPATVQLGKKRAFSLLFAHFGRELPVGDSRVAQMAGFPGSADDRTSHF